MGEIVIIPRQEEINALPREDFVRNHLLEVAENPNFQAKATAPYETGAGAASIHAEAFVGAAGAWEVRSTWDTDHYYMHFHERGTQTLPARPFLVPAWEGQGVTR